jgi:hypothetical protein
VLIAELHAVECRVGVAQANPTVDRDHGDDAAAFGREGVDFLGERVELVLLGDKKEGGKLLPRAGFEHGVAKRGLKRQGLHSEPFAHGDKDGVLGRGRGDGDLGSGGGFGHGFSCPRAAVMLVLSSV